ncbi:uncharacterized protein GGS25DRAFT_530719 [Hypoxylon fragiforme]|uniref:uncharacterized protein n=1 Tax=Hypoxylon fragiforme TaxID=63214 RepID=UPI0020C72558|nr:uncharacterized protein GGS25DRAFT_530719 [Hypoxylon fragiforme]KAI2609634.1 hypothetical protein GGS25DRAFT_530719 [Hypoxylon fragiforme]
MKNTWGVVGWVRIAAFLMPIHACVVNGLSWRSGQRSSSETKDFAHADATDGSISQFQEHGSQSPSLYEVARHELRELEFEPLCQQSAARILANNCELLGTKNEATILTTSGRLVRDFVDSLEPTSGSELWPFACLFRGNQVLPLWLERFFFGIEYLAEDIRRFKHLVDIVEKFTSGLEKEGERASQQHESQLQAATDKFFQNLEDAWADMEARNNNMTEPLARMLKENTDALRAQQENTFKMQRMYEEGLKNALEDQARMKSAHERSVEVANQNIESVANAGLERFASIAQSLVQFQTELELLRDTLETTHLSLNQDAQETAAIIQDTMTKLEQLESTLEQVQNVSVDIQETLEDTAVSAAYVSDSFYRQSPLSSWWPYVWCPAVSLVLGSYGLPPSVTRNVVLVTLGEFAGFTLSSFQSVHSSLSSIQVPGVSGFLSTWGGSSPANDTDDTRAGTDNDTEVSQDI